MDERISYTVLYDVIDAAEGGIHRADLIDPSDLVVIQKLADWCSELLETGKLTGATREVFLATLRDMGFVERNESEEFLEA